MSLRDALRGWRYRIWSKFIHRFNYHHMAAYVPASRPKKPPSKSGSRLGQQPRAIPPHDPTRGMQ